MPTADFDVDDLYRPHRPVSTLTRPQLVECLSIWNGYTPQEHMQMRASWSAMSAIDPNSSRECLMQRWKHFAEYCDVRDRRPYGWTWQHYSKSGLLNPAK